MGDNVRQQLEKRTKTILDLEFDVFDKNKEFSWEI